MSLQTLLIFLPACFALNMAFGPNNLLSLTIGAQYGLRVALIAAAGRMAAFTIMIATAALGMGALLMASGTLFTFVKLAGAAYLVWLGIRLWRARPQTVGAVKTGHDDDLWGFIRKEFFVAIGNPKAILIFTAFFPQFVDQSMYWQNFVALGVVFMLLELVAIAAYAFAGNRLQGVIRSPRAMRRVNKVSGAMMISFGTLLTLAQRPAA